MPYGNPGNPSSGRFATDSAGGRKRSGAWPAVFQWNEGAKREPPSGFPQTTWDFVARLRWASASSEAICEPRVGLNDEP